MVKPRIIETEQGIQEPVTVEVYDQMMRRLRDRGWIETGLVLTTGIDHGAALEVGPGPGYVGLEWLKKTTDTTLRALEISPEMIRLAERNAQDYELEERVKYIQGDAHKMPFDDETFDGVFTNNSLHEWVRPIIILNEIWRVLKSGGRYCISDFRRDMNSLMKCFLYIIAKPTEIRSGLTTSINASYTPEEIRPVLESSELRGYILKKNIIGLTITGQKTGTG